MLDTISNYKFLVFPVQQLWEKTHALENRDLTLGFLYCSVKVENHLPLGAFNLMTDLSSHAILNIISRVSAIRSTNALLRGGKSSFGRALFFTAEIHLKFS